ncbi:MAG: phosphatase PAP2 family protein [Candidatus Cloacimonadales bacterium]|jgi:membrane-associated phospholipid phosphatase|nr:phosphatase PAP2 family protein [Candidatus Cloacimonadota bacterium]MDX9977430.1 phosphatase PAP2 family protein [Candidatus Cloacimonadales bacterium]MDD2649550.1 phosphatase PAP2 family protein [Candidatus Cloacimonadota bacterium]HPY95889.1 phosphatase PAP2 family protein [Candidatus Cloacimonadota bacterium]HPY95891.1 phosphatase PAP2 family protein [Candidatus Cloacimonadota bacterium]
MFKNHFNFDRLKIFFSIFNKTDIITLIYIAINLIYISIGYQRIENAQGLLLIFLSIATLLLAIAHYDDKLSMKADSFASRILHFAHLWFAPAFFALFYEATSQVNLVVFSEYLDPIVQKWDYLIFGYQPALVWGTKWDWAWLQELMHFSYFSYYMMIFIVPFYIYFRRKEDIFKRIVFNISFVFYLCYFFYMVLPVTGGRAIEEAFALTVEYRYGVFTHIMAFIYRMSPHFGGAFPSSHVAIALTISIISAKYIKYLPYILFPLTFMLSISTVYCHYHYFVDVPVGAACGALFFYLSEKAFKKIKVVDKKTINRKNRNIIFK